MNSSVVGIFLVLGIIFIAIAGGSGFFRSGPGETVLPSNQTNATSSGTTLGSGSGSGASGSGAQNLSVSEQIKKVSRQIEELEEKIKKANEEAGASVYKGKVRISSVSKAGTNEAYIRLSAQSNLSSDILISGWKLRSKMTGGEQIIGPASNLPYTAPVAPIFLPRSGKVIVSQAYSPLGFSFRLNKCTGFLNQGRTFSPNLERICPTPREDAPALSPYIDQVCKNYINGLPSCEIPNSSNFPNSLNYYCRQYLLTEINYNSCVNKHINDSDFYRNEWRVFPYYGAYPWKADGDSIELLDDAGKVVDTFSY